MAHRFTHYCPTKHSMGYPHSQALVRQPTPSTYHHICSGLKDGIPPPPVRCPRIPCTLARSFALCSSALWHPLLLVFFCGHYNVSEVSALNSVRPRKERRSLSKGWGKRSRSTTSPSLPCFSSPLAIQALLRKQSYSFFTGFLLYTMTAFSW